MNPEITLTSSIWGEKRKYWFWVYISCIVIFYEFFFKQTDVTSSDFYKNYAIWCPTVKRQDVPCFNIDFQLHSYVSGKQLLFKIYNSYKHWSSTNRLGTKIKASSDISSKIRMFSIYIPFNRNASIHKLPCKVLNVHQ